MLRKIDRGGCKPTNRILPFNMRNQLPIDTNVASGKQKSAAIDLGLAEIPSLEELRKRRSASEEDKTDN